MLTGMRLGTRLTPVLDPQLWEWSANLIVPCKRERTEAEMTESNVRRWLYRGQRSNWIAKIINRAWAAVVSSGAASNLYVTLEVTAHKSGRTIALPVLVAVV